MQQAQAKGLTLLVADNKTGYFGVIHLPDRPKPYLARIKRGGKNVTLSSFATAEEAALCVARSPEGQEGAKKAAAPAPLTSEEARQQAQKERLVLLVADNKTGFFGVRLAKPARPRPYQSQVKRGGKDTHLGSFVTAEEAALCVARSPEGQAAAEKAAVTPLTGEEARQQAQAERLTLRVGRSGKGYFGVYHKPDRPKPYKAKVRRGGKEVHLGSFATAEEAALCIARSPEGQVVAEKTAAAPPLASDVAGGDDAGEEEGEENIPVLDAVEVLVASDDDSDDEALAEAEEATFVLEKKRARESTHLSEEDSRARSTRLPGTNRHR